MEKLTAPVRFHQKKLASKLDWQTGLGHNKIEVMLERVDTMKQGTSWSSIF